jgi:hypothetical protein
MPICARRTSNLVWTAEHPPPILAVGEAAVINMLWAATPPDSSGADAPETMLLVEIDQVPAPFRPAQATPHYGVPQGKAGHRHRGRFCGRTIRPATGHSAMAGRESSP